MEAMRNTGIRWIGEIPSDWKTKRIKYMATLKGRIGWQGLTSDEYQDDGAFLITGVDFQNGCINWEQCEHVPMKRWEEARDIQLENGDLLITKDGTVGKVAIVSDMPGETSLNSGVLRIMPFDGYSRRFLYWVLLSEEFWNWFNIKNAGNSTIIHLYQGDFAGFMYAFPEFAEQEAIATYLDCECAKLDAIIGTIEKQIDLLKQRRKAVINEAVTRGLGNDLSTLKYSGNPYVGLIASNAKAIRFKYIATIEADLVDPQKYPDALQVSPENIVSNTGELIDVTTVDEVGVDSWNQRFYAGEIIYSKIRPALNKVTIAPFDGLCSADMYPITTILPTKYLMYYMLSDSFVRQTIDVSSIRVKMPKVNQEELSNFVVVIHTQDVMEHIAQYLDETCASIDKVLSEKEHQLGIAIKHKKALIYEYVTGKKRVKEVQTNAHQS